MSWQVAENGFVGGHNVIPINSFRQGLDDQHRTAQAVVAWYGADMGHFEGVGLDLDLEGSVHVLGNEEDEFAIWCEGAQEFGQGV